MIFYFWMTFLPGTVKDENHDKPMLADFQN